MNVTRISSCYASQASYRVDGPHCRTPEERYDVRTAEADGQPYDAYVPSNLASSPIQPPWRVLPWPGRVEPITHCRTAVVVVVKANPAVPDVGAVGRTLDVFV